jgi:hypothetical protein
MRLSKLVYAAATLMLSLAVVSTARQAQNNGGSGGNGGNGNAAPELVIESATHDFGEVKTGTPLKWAFKIKNTGKADLLITNVAPG